MEYREDDPLASRSVGQRGNMYIYVCMNGRAEKRDMQDGGKLHVYLQVKICQGPRHRSAQKQRKPGKPRGADVGSGMMDVETRRHW